MTLDNFYSDQSNVRCFTIRSYMGLCSAFCVYCGTEKWGEVISRKKDEQWLGWVKLNLRGSDALFKLFSLTFRKWSEKKVSSESIKSAPSPLTD